MGLWLDPGVLSHVLGGNLPRGNSPLTTFRVWFYFDSIIFGQLGCRTSGMSNNWTWELEKIKIEVIHPTCPTNFEQLGCRTKDLSDMWGAPFKTTLLFTHVEKITHNAAYILYGKEVILKITVSVICYCLYSQVRTGYMSYFRHLRCPTNMSNMSNFRTCKKFKRPTTQLVDISVI